MFVRNENVIPRSLVAPLHIRLATSRFRAGWNISSTSLAIEKN